MCSWKYGSFEKVFYSKYKGCLLINSLNYSVKCAVKNEILDTGFKLLTPVPSGSNSFTLFCEDFNVTSFNLSTEVFVESKQIIGCTTMPTKYC